jgi:hypothetical protein
MKTYGGAEVQFFTSAPDGGEQFTPRSLSSPKKEPLVPIGYEVVLVPEHVWTLCRRNPFLLSRIESLFLYHEAGSLVARRTKLSLLHHTFVINL